MAFEPFKRARQLQTQSPLISLHKGKSRSFAFNPAATTLFFEVAGTDDVSKLYVKFLFDEETRTLALEPATHIDDYTYKINPQSKSDNSRINVNGAAIAAHYNLASGARVAKRRNNWIVLEMGPAVSEEQEQS